MFNTFDIFDSIGCVNIFIITIFIITIRLEIFRRKMMSEINFRTYS